MFADSLRIESALATISESWQGMRRERSIPEELGAYPAFG
jgi:hypothetical protein